MTDLNHPFIRNIELRIGPLPAWKGGGDSAKAVKIRADGSNDKLRIKFSARSHIVSTATPTVISIYNLSRGLRNSLQSPGIFIVLKAGWANVGMLNVFEGGVLACVHYREGADIVTTLTCLSDGENLNRAIISHTAQKGTKLSVVIGAIATRIPGVTVSDKLIQVPDVRLGSGGISLHGSARCVLNKLARSYGFNWWIDKGVFKAVSDLTGLVGSSVKISSSNGFLLRAEPILTSPFQIQSGVTISCLFNPLIEAGGIVQLESKINPALNGSYVVHSLSHSGDSHSNSWSSTTETWWRQQG